MGQGKLDAPDPSQTLSNDTAAWNAAQAAPVSLSGLSTDESNYLNGMAYNMSQAKGTPVTAQQAANSLAQATPSGQTWNQYLSGIVANNAKGAAMQGETPNQALTRSNTISSMYGPTQYNAQGQQIATPSQVTLNDNIANYGSTTAPIYNSSLFDKVLEGIAIAGATAGFAPAAVAAGADLAGSAGAIGGGALAGGGLGAATAYGSGSNIGKAALTGALGGAAGVVASPAISALSSTGVPAPVAAGLVKGAIGAGTGALRNGSTGALIGGIAGAASGAVGNATGSPSLGMLGGTIASNLASRYATPSSAAAPSAAAPAAAAPASSATPLPPQASVGSVTQPSATPGISTGSNGLLSFTPASPASAPTTSLNGLGYAPRQQTDASGINYSNYGQGPEFQFFKPST